jgi:predicted ATPase
MPTGETVTSIEFRNFKAFAHFSLKLQHMNVLVGPNNSGKSTVLGALRILAEALRKARSKSAERVHGPSGDRLGYHIAEDNLSVSIENVHTDYSDTDTRVTFRLSNQNSLDLYFPTDGGCILLADTQAKPVRTPAEFKRAFPLAIGVVPVLGPVEHDEQILAEETVRRGLATHRASRHFRNYWYHYHSGFDAFAEMVCQTWPGMTIKPPERADQLSSKLVMFAEEHRIPRELFWSGFGFQVWCQLLTHITRATNDTLLVIDEPEIYLHPDVQRQFLGILRDVGPDIILATHSTEIMGEADPAEILLIDKAKRSAQRLRDVEGVQAAMNAVGSIQNITLTRLARNRRVLFIEGAFDFKVIRRFARLLGFHDLAAGNDLTPVESGGFTSWERVKATAWGIEKALGDTIKIAAVFDRDYFSPEEISSIVDDLASHLELAHIHERKEMENYLLVPEVLERALAKASAERARRTGDSPAASETIAELLNAITNPMKGAVQAQYIAKRTKFFERERLDPATITAATIEWFDSKWNDLGTRMEIVPGKEVLSSLRDRVQSIQGVSLTDVRIIDEFRITEVPGDLKSLIEKLDQYRSGSALAD